MDRLVARAKDDPRTLPTLLETAPSDEVWRVRDAVVVRLVNFDASDVLDALRRAASDPHPEVRDSARYALGQLGLTYGISANRGMCGWPPTSERYRRQSRPGVVSYSGSQTSGP